LSFRSEAEESAFDFVFKVVILSNAKDLAVDLAFVFDLDLALARHSERLFTSAQNPCIKQSAIQPNIFQEDQTRVPHSCGFIAWWESICKANRALVFDLAPSQLRKYICI
jgi:hypothetical protein